MFKKGIHHAVIKHLYLPFRDIECMVEYNGSDKLYIYSNCITFNGTTSKAFENNSHGFIYCWHARPDYIKEVKYTNFLGEL